MIGIRVDGNEKIGTGHLMRCLSIANALRDLGISPVFFTVDRNEILARSGFECCYLKGVYDDLSGEDLLPYLEQYQVTTLLADTYFADSAYFAKLAGKVKTAYIFDFGDTSMPVDILINYNFNYDSFRYPKEKKVLLGCAYVPLRKEFQNIYFIKNYEKAKNILITTGGTDKYNITSQLIRRIRLNPSLGGAVLHVVIGSLNVFAEEIKKLADELPGILWYENCSHMAELMLKCDIAISAGGSTLYELCACGIPSITFSMADNQVDIVNVMGKKGIMLSAGHYEKNAEGCLDAIMDLLGKLARDASLRESFSKIESKLVDGKGAERLARVVMKLDRFD